MIWSLNRLRPIGEMVVSKILIKVSDGKYALSARRGVLGRDGIQWFTGLERRMDYEREKTADCSEASAVSFLFF